MPHISRLIPDAMLIIGSPEPIVVGKDGVGKEGTTHLWKASGCFGVEGGSVVDIGLRDQK